MHEYDVTLKTILTRPGCGILADFAGRVGEACLQTRWHNVELPEVRNLRVDLLGETPSGALLHIELQRSNDPRMILRMAHYALAIHEQFGRWPQQFVLYVGLPALRMPNRLDSHSLSFACHMVDIREFDSESLLASPILQDNVLAILGRLRDARDVVRRILARIMDGDPARRAIALKQLTILSGLRKLGSVISQETRKMPILDDLMDHDLLGPAIRQGRQEGLQEGRQEGRLEGERHFLDHLITLRFGSIPEWAASRLDSCTVADLERIGSQLFDAKTLEQLLG